MQCKAVQLSRHSSDFFQLSAHCRKSGVHVAARYLRIRRRNAWLRQSRNGVTSTRNLLKSIQVKLILFNWAPCNGPAAASALGTVNPRGPPNSPCTAAVCAVGPVASGCKGGALSKGGGGMMPLGTGLVLSEASACGSWACCACVGFG